MGVRFQVTESGLNGVTPESWRAARDDLSKVARDALGDKFIDVATQLTRGNGVVSLNSFTVHSNSLTDPVETLPDTVCVEAVNVYGETLMKTVPVTLQGRHV